MSDPKSILSELVQSLPSAPSLTWDAICVTFVAISASVKTWAPKVIPPLITMLRKLRSTFPQPAVSTPLPVMLHPSESQYIMTDFSKAFAALTTSLIQGAPHLRALESIFNEAAPVVESLVPGAAAVVNTVQAVEGAADTVINASQEALTGAVTTPPVPPSLAMAQETVAVVATALGQSATTSGSVPAGAPVPSTVPAVPMVLVNAQPSLPDNAPSDLSATGGVDAAALAVGGVASAAATPDQFAARLATVETFLATIAPVIADYVKQRGI